MSDEAEAESNTHRLPTREETLARGKPFPAYEEVVIDGLTDDQGDAFLRAIAEA